MNVLSQDVLKFDISYLNSSLLFKKDEYTILLLSELFIAMFQVIFKANKNETQNKINELSIEHQVHENIEKDSTESEEEIDSTFHVKT